MSRNPQRDSAGAHQNNLEQHLLVHLHELLVPLVDIGGLTAVVIVVGGAGGIALVVLAPLNNFLEDRFVDLRQLAWEHVTPPPQQRETYIGDGNGLARVTQVLQHVLDQDGSLGDSALCFVSVGPCTEHTPQCANIPTETSTPSELVRVI